MPLVRFGHGDRVYTFPEELIQNSDPRFRDAVPRVTRLPGVHGGFDHLGDGIAPMEIGNVRVSFYLATDDLGEMDALRDALTALLDWGKDLLWMQPDDRDEAERFCWARLNNIQMPQQEAKFTDVHQTVTLSFQVSDPHWYVPRMEGPLWGTVDWGDGSKWGGDAALQTVSGTSTSLTAASNDGNAIALPRVTFYVAAGQTLVNPRIQRLKNALVVDEIGYEGTLVAGDILEINCREASLLLNKQDAYADRSDFLHPDWLRLEPGSNSLRVLTDSASSAGKVAVRWYDTYR